MALPRGVMGQLSLARSISFTLILKNKCVMISYICFNKNEFYKSLLLIKRSFEMYAGTEVPSTQPKLFVKE